MKAPYGCVLVLIVALCSAPLTTAKGCSSVANYDFRPLREAANARRLKIVPKPWTINNLANNCDTTRFCNAFNTRGFLLRVPLDPVFSVLDATTSGQCDGVYVRNRTLSGLTATADKVDALRSDGAKNSQDMVAAASAAIKVAPKLKAMGVKITNPQNLAPSQLSQVAAAFQSIKTPLAQESNVTGSYSFNKVLNALAYPEWDSRSVNGTNYISSIKDQGNCGSCVSFAATAAAEAAVATGGGLTGKTNTYDYSEQWLFFCNQLYHPTCDTGWDADPAANVLIKKSIPLEINYPYKQKPDCTLYGKDTRPTGSFGKISIKDLDTAKAHIRKYGAVLTYFAVYNDFFDWTKTSPPYVWDGRSALSGYHQVLCIGYSDSGHYWIAKNSWGISWGDNGYFRMSYTNRAGFMSAAGDNIVGLTYTPAGARPPPPLRTPSRPPSPRPAKPSPRPPLPTSPSRRPRPPPPPTSPPPSPLPPSPWPPSPSPPSPNPPSPFPPPSPPPAPICGDGLCSQNETCKTCPTDCGDCAVCGDGYCSGAETCKSCPKDCGYKQRNGNYTCCGDKVCSPGDGETCLNCPGDCGACSRCNNNGICEPLKGENCTSTGKGCADCGDCAGNRCGDGKCTFNLLGYSETCGTCPMDCGRCKDSFYCGDGLCTTERKEDIITCSRDCANTWTVPPEAWVATPPPSAYDYSYYDYESWDYNAPPPAQ